MDRLRLIKDQPDPLFAWRSSAPARSCAVIENRFNRIAVSFRSDLNFGPVPQVEPLAIVCCDAKKRG